MRPRRPPAAAVPNRTAPSNVDLLYLRWYKQGPVDLSGLFGVGHGLRLASPAGGPWGGNGTVRVGESLAEKGERLPQLCSRPRLVAAQRLKCPEPPL